MKKTAVEIEETKEEFKSDVIEVMAELESTKKGAA